MVQASLAFGAILPPERPHVALDLAACHQLLQRHTEAKEVRAVDVEEARQRARAHAASALVEGVTGVADHRLERLIGHGLVGVSHS